MMLKNVFQFARKSLILSLFILMLQAPAFADEAQCKAVLHDCDTALKAQQSVNALQAQIIKDEDARFAAQTTELNIEKIWKPIAVGGLLVIGVETLVLILKH